MSALPWQTQQAESLLELLLWPDVGCVPTGLLAAVGGPGVEPGVAHPADHLVAVVLLGQDPQARLDDSTPQPEDKMKRALLLDVIVGQSPPVLQLLPGKDEPLLVRGNPLLVLDL